MEEKVILGMSCWIYVCWEEASKMVWSEGQVLPKDGGVQDDGDMEDECKGLEIKSWYCTRRKPDGGAGAASAHSDESSSRLVAVLEKAKVPHVVLLSGARSGSKPTALSNAPGGSVSVGISQDGQASGGIPREDAALCIAMVAMNRKPEGAVVVAAVAEPRKVIRPPKDYDHRRILQQRSRAIIESEYPELKDLSDEGTLIAIPRPDDYVERRTDGYREPEIVFVLGTAHVSVQAAAEVERVISAIQPENVVVELCKSRSSVMYEASAIRKLDNSGKNLLDMTGENMIETFQRSVALGGQSALLLRLLLSQVASRMANRLNVEAGMEFVAARRAAEAIDAQVVLGDRPIEVTLKRAWKSLSLRQKINFLKLVIVGFQYSNSSLVDVKKLEEIRKDDDAVNAMLYALADAFPEVAEALVFERDLYLAWSLKRSKAVNGTKRVVGVLGKGHMRGVCYALTHDSGNLRFRDLAGSRKPSPDDVRNTIGRIALETGIFTILWWSWTQLH
eukprot:jgi/Picre1/29015/NNA_004409.t1